MKLMDVMQPLLAPETGAGEAGEPATFPESTQTAGGENKVSFDDFLKDPSNQAEFDRRISKALETQKASLAEANKKALEDARKEADKLAKMNADQKKDYEMEQLKAENERLRQENMRTELGRTASELLKEKDIDATQDILDFVVGADADSTKTNIDKFVEIVQAQVKAAEVKRATGSTPKSYGNAGPVDVFQERIAKYRRN